MDFPYCPSKLSGFDSIGFCLNLVSANSESLGSVIICGNLSCRICGILSGSTALLKSDNSISDFGASTRTSTKFISGSSTNTSPYCNPAR